MFAEGLVDEGFSVWWDASLHSGETFDEVIEQKLRDAGAVVVLWSPRSVASRWVRAEATLADRRKKLAPAIIEPCDRPIIFELTHAADLCEWTGDITDIHWRTFVDDLRRLTDAKVDHDSHSAAPSAVRAEPPAASQRALPSRDRGADRRPLRPGNDEVIVARQSPHASPVSHSRGGRPHHPVEADVHAEVHCLELEHGELEKELFVVDSSGVKVGRTAPADIIVSHKGVSREHCIVGLAADELLVTDLNSTNGTFVDDVRVSRATILPVGSVLRVGQISLKHVVHTPAEVERRIGLHHASKEGGLRAGRVAVPS